MSEPTKVSFSGSKSRSRRNRTNTEARSRGEGGGDLLAEFLKSGGDIITTLTKLKRQSPEAYVDALRRIASHLGNRAMLQLNLEVTKKAMRAGVAQGGSTGHAKGSPVSYMAGAGDSSSSKETSPSPQDGGGSTLDGPPREIYTESDLKQFLAEPMLGEDYFERLFEILRHMQPVGEDGEFTSTDQELFRRVSSSGYMLWKAKNIRRFGPESNWPPVLRRDTSAMVTKAYQLIESSSELPPADMVADILRPLNTAAQHQILSYWRSHGEPAHRSLKNLDARKKYFDLILAKLSGDRFQDEDPYGDAPILDLHERSEAEQYDYFKKLAKVRGYTFVETDTSNPKNRILYYAFNVRFYDLTTTKGHDSPRTKGSQYTGRLFLVWKDAKGKHVRSWLWSNTGKGGSKSKKTKQIANKRFADGTGMGSFEGNSLGMPTKKDKYAIKKNKDIEGLVRMAGEYAKKAKIHLKSGNKVLMMTKSTINVPNRSNQSLKNAETAARLALLGKKMAKLVAMSVARIKQLNNGKLPDGSESLANVEDEVVSAARKLFDDARDFWNVAYMQHRSVEEEKALQRWQKMVESGDSKASEAYHEYDSLRQRNAELMKEDNALPWLQEGQYFTRKGKKYGTDMWSVNMGVRGKKGGGFVAVDRDWNSNLLLDDSESKVYSSSIGTGVLIHTSKSNGDNTGWSIGCQIAPKNIYAKFVKVLRQGGKDAQQFSYIVVDARHMPPFE